ncbi:TIGR01244 family sulfur transferase [Brevundimonas sp.]|uniref:TIGR01244 family sulfur transferase n=1 Tax=Brevundimonas sp. TaxID=1871086 RepID=UPI003F717B84
MTLRPLSPTVSVSAQLSPDVMPALAASGVGRVINNRPDGEEPDQPPAAAMEAAARDAGLTFAWIPVSGLPGPDQVAAMAELLADGVPTVMFCRSGMRSAAAWAMAERLKGADAQDLREAAAAAGYDLGRVPL